MTGSEYTPTPERLDPSFLIQFVRQNSCFDADLLAKIIAEWKQFKQIGTATNVSIGKNRSHTAN